MEKLTIVRKEKQRHQFKAKNNALFVFLTCDNLFLNFVFSVNNTIIYNSKCLNPEVTIVFPFSSGTGVPINGQVVVFYG